MDENQKKWHEFKKQLMSHPDFAVDPYSCMVDVVRSAVNTALKYQGAIGAGPEWDLVQEIRVWLEKA